MKYDIIVQIIAPASPVYAVFTLTTKPRVRADMLLVPCPVLALTKGQEVIGLIVEANGLSAPILMPNFLGYAADEHHAAAEFLPEPTDAKP